MFLNRLKTGVARFNKATTRKRKVFILALLAPFGVVVVFTLFNMASQAYDSYRSNHLTSAENLRSAEDVCASGSGSSGICSDPEDALHHLEKIPTTAPEHGEASKLIASIQQQQHRASLEAAQSERQLQQQEQQLEQQQALEGKRAWEQALRNFHGEASDPFQCSISAGNQPIVTFDNGLHWWTDEDDLCATETQTRRDEITRLREAQEAAAEEQEAKAAADLQEQRDANAKLSSYWPTTLRVDTDMDSSWLPSEERTCQTYPDDKGKIAVVACNATGSHRNHNIPVEFWGGVDRNTISDWRCRREKNLLDDKFVCRAID